MNIDLFPTCLAAAGITPPTDRVIDGLDISNLISDPSAVSPHEYFYFYHQGALEGVRRGKWKYFRNISHYSWPMPVNKKLGYLANHTTGPLPLLFNLELDPGESYNLAGNHPDIVKELDDAMRRWDDNIRKNPLGIIK